MRRRNPRVLLAEQINGGGHERGMRSGIVNVPGIVGFGKAAAMAKAEMPTESERLRGLRDKLNAALHAGLDEIYINGSMEHRLPHNLNISFAYVEGESLLMGINDVAVSSGSRAPRPASSRLRAEGTGRRRRPGALVDLVRPRAVEHRGRSGYVVEKLTSVVRRLRHVAALRDGQGRRGSVHHAVGYSLRIFGSLPKTEDRRLKTGD